MAAKAHLELFFERYLDFNLERYQNNPQYLAAFTGLTYADVTISGVVETGVGTNRKALVVSVARNFRENNASWTPSDAATDLDLYVLKNESPLASLNDLEDQTEPGLYSYVDGEDVKVGVVIANGVVAEDIPTTVEALLRANLQYDIPTVTVAEGGTTAVLVGDSFLGTLEWVEGTAPVLIIPDTDYGQLKAKPAAP